MIKLFGYFVVFFIASNAFAADPSLELVSGRCDYRVNKDRSFDLKKLDPASQAIEKVIAKGGHSFPHDKRQTLLFEVVDHNGEIVEMRLNSYYGSSYSHSEFNSEGEQLFNFGHYLVRDPEDSEKNEWVDCEVLLQRS